MLTTYSRWLDTSHRWATSEHASTSALTALSYPLAIARRDMFSLDEWAAAATDSITSGLVEHRVQAYAWDRVEYPESL